MIKKIILAITLTAILFIWVFGSSYHSVDTLKKYGLNTKVKHFVNQPRWSFGTRLILSGVVFIWGAGMSLIFINKK